MKVIATILLGAVIIVLIMAAFQQFNRVLGLEDDDET